MKSIKELEALGFHFHKGLKSILEQRRSTLIITKQYRDLRLLRFGILVTLVIILAYKPICMEDWYLEHYSNFMFKGLCKEQVEKLLHHPMQN